MKKTALLLSVVVGLGVACVDPQDPTPPPTDTPVVDDDVTLTPDADGLVHADVLVDGAQGLQTLGVAIEVENADIVSWERDDALLTQAGGQVLPLESRVRGRSLRLVLGTTAAVTSSDAQRIASLVLRPTGEGEVSVRVVASGDDLGFLDRSGNRLPVTTRIANGGEG